MENEPEERDAMQWLMDDELMRQREEASKYDENVTVKRSAGRKLLVEKVQRAPGLVVVQAQLEKKDR